MKQTLIKVGLSVLIWTLLVVNSFSQSRNVADRYFNEFSYVRAAELYKALYLVHKDDSKHVLTRLADSYYNNANTEDAEKWYAKLIERYYDNIDDTYLFRYAQVLRSNQKYKKSDSILLALGVFSNKSLLKGKGDLTYIEEYTKMKEQRVSVRNVSTNTKFSDYGGVVNDGTVYFSSSNLTLGRKQRIYSWNNQPFLNLFRAKKKFQPVKDSEKDTVVELGKPSILEKPVTTDYHEGRPVFTKDGKTMYFTRNNFDGKKVNKDKERTVNLKIFKARLVGATWTNVVEMPFNSDHYSVGHPALSSDERTLYFTSDMPGGYGATDIYKVALYEEGTCGEPENLGEEINTTGREVFPFIGSDEVLYFSSDGHLGLGLLDVFKSKFEKEKKRYVEVENLGSPYNSNKDDFSFYIDKEDKYGFFSSNRKDGKGDDDIYSFFIYTDIPVYQHNISGRVFDDETNEPIAEAVVSIINKDGQIVDEVLTDADGKYKFSEVLFDEDEYTVKAAKFDYKPFKKEVKLTKGEDIENLDITIIPLVIGNQIVIKPIHFDLEEYVIRDDAKYELENIYAVMTNHPQIVIRIEAHTDSRGTNSFNQVLSDKRAEATRDYLIERGVAPERIESIKGYGESKLLNDCDDRNQNKCTEEEHQMNRRSFFYVVKGEEEIKLRRENERQKSIKRIEERRAKIKKLRGEKK